MSKLQQKAANTVGIVVVALTILVLFATLLRPAKADDKLHEGYLGMWCSESDPKGNVTTYPIYREGKCEDGLKIERGKYTAYAEDTCYFTSVRKTGKTFGVAVHQPKSDWVPQFIIEGKCSGEGSVWKTKEKWTLHKGGLEVENLSPKNQRTCATDGQLNVRDKPYGKILATLNTNGEYNIFSLREYAKDKRGDSWVKIETFDGWQGWAFERYLKCMDN
jgi:hypothetical protein